MKDKVFLRIEKGGVNGQYYKQLEQLADKLGLDATKSILWSIVYANQTLDESEIKNAKRKYQ